MQFFKDFKQKNRSYPKIKDLAEHMGVHYNTARLLIKNLEELEFIERRKLKFYLTAK